MRSTDIGQFTSLLHGVMSLYGRDISEQQADLWFGALDQYDVAAVSQALNAWVRNPDEGKWPPKPADVIRMIEGSTGDRGLLAWSLVDRAVRSLGPYQTLVFEDPIIHQVISDMGGWIDLCGTATERDFEFKGKEFEKRYRAYASRGGVQDYPAKLPGLSEVDRGQKGLPAPDPKLVGDPQRALTVLQQGGAGQYLPVHGAASILKRLGHGGDDAEA